MAMEYDLSDIRAATGSDGMFGGNGLWFLALLFLFGNGGWGNYGNRGNVATTEDLASGFNFNSLQGKTNDILAAVNGVNQNIGNAVCTSTYELGSKIDSCCCNTQLGIQGVKFDMANYAAGTNAAIAEQTQKILDAITGNRMADMQNQINALQLQSALCGVVRYPTSMAYTAGYSPFCGYTNGCGCTNI